MSIKKIDEIAKRRGFFWPSFEIYNGLSGFYDYGPVGTLLKIHIEDMIRKAYVIEEGFLSIEAPTLSPIEVWIASGHVKSFGDIIAECSKCNELYRADHLIEELLHLKTDGMKMKDLQTLIEKNKLKCPKCHGEFKKLYEYNLMFKTTIGPGKTKVEGALRPETAQTSYLPFTRLFELARKKIPFGVIQIGRSYRNEISPRKGIIRLREFSQAEAQYFLDPDKKNQNEKFSKIETEKLRISSKDGEKEIYAKELAEHTNKNIVYFIVKSIKLFESMGINRNKLVCRQHSEKERAFYSKDTWDIEFLSDIYGRIELVGVSDRGDYDLTRHSELSKINMSVPLNGKKIIPNVIEVAYGIDRPLWCILESSIDEKDKRVFFKFNPRIAPYTVAVFPLVKKDRLPEKAKKIVDMLKNEGLYVMYDETGSIGRMYYRQDEIGTPYCITVDYESIENNDVTIRDRDTQKQMRIKINEIANTIHKLVNGSMTIE